MGRHSRAVIGGFPNLVASFYVFGVGFTDDICLLLLSLSISGTPLFGEVFTYLCLMSASG